ncbi:hypothetical protein GI584_00335 [Gracilibacillus salitolerans]|uniref:Uncharacterized protein n=1 Tax=Gracilibacillus salitolerans TaxID=2663022 RepID=A0A5Q2TES8_9BACI|nr:hypothetical protein [Gracilibacillus salitolerans]QGH32622.1 hypothetical protein GI584_00335 [Gracilibacillus salitolerans]
MSTEVETNQTESFKQALQVMEDAVPYAKKMYQSDVLQAAARLMDEEDGMEILYQHADRFDKAGVFEGGPWAEPSHLEPRLVTGSLMDSGMTSIVEILSELRMVAIAKGKYKHEVVTKDAAKHFLDEVMALNVDILFPEETEAARIEGKQKEKNRAEKLFQFLADKLSLASISGKILEEIDDLVAQRPIMVNRIVSMIKDAKKLLKQTIEEKEKRAIKRYVNALSGPTKKSKKYQDPCEYRKQLKEMSDQELEEEAKVFAKSMREKGLVSKHHVVLVRYLNRHNQKLLPTAMQLNKKGKANLEEHYDIVSDLITVAIHLPMRQSLYGLACMLERGVLSSTPVIPGLKRLIELDLQPEVRKVLLNSINDNEGITANDIMLAGVISVLGQPLGIGQGMNPTCQTARGISLWSLHAPGYLLELIPRAARDGDIDVQFEGQTIHSKNLHEGLVQDLHEELDPVSLILVPHLDRIYGELVRRSEFRGDDVHKWVNPAFYGDWISRGFSSTIDPMTGSVADYPGFVRLFYATHHPDYNNGYELIYPNPVGIFITNSFGNLLGLHAVSIQRVARDSDGKFRIYFYNPNNDSAQVWGQGITPTVKGHGEYPGESSLPFHEFVARLYAFHYNPYEQGDAYAVDNQNVEKVEQLARESWGQKYTWVQL